MTGLSSTRLEWYAAGRAPRAPPPDTCVHTQVLARLRAEPERMLLVDARGGIVNGALHAAIDRRARLLLERCGEPGAAVAVALEPGIELVVTYFACLAAGLRYLPLPAAPRGPLERMLPALAPRLLVTHASHALADGAGIEAWHVERSAEAAAGKTALPRCDPYRIAHVLPTSGTETGLPKAVLTNHVGSLLSHAWRTRCRPLDARHDVVGCNIFGIWDVVPALAAGVPAVMLDDAAVRDPLALAAAILRFGLTRLMLTPTLLDACLASGEATAALARLTRLVLCGEPVPADLAARAAEALPATAVDNLYSLSECHDVAAGPVGGGARVADFADVHVTEASDRTRLVATGTPGRIVVGGAALAAGYADPALTARKFFDCDYGHGTERVYDTGDRGILHADGTLTVLGRLDRAVKVRGAWVEPDAVAAVLEAHPDIARAQVFTEPGRDGALRLAAGVVARAGIEARPDALGAWLAARVAPQSVPARIDVTTDIALTPAGKADPRAGRTRDTDVRRGVSVETHVLAVLRDVLERPALAADDDPALRDVDSLTRVVLCGRLADATGRRVRIGDVAAHDSARSLARALAGQPGRPQRSLDALPTLGVAGPLRGAAATVARVLVTGGTGALGRALIAMLMRDTDLAVVALVRARDAADARARLRAHLPETFDAARIDAVAGDLAQPRFGLGATAFDALADRVDAVVHAGADLDMFADYASLAPANVDGTRDALRIACAGGARFHHVSSSAVFPLDPARAWDESARGTQLIATLAPMLAGSDGYSLTKLAAEALVWQAAELGLPVAVTRVPHLVGPGHATRLGETLRALIAAGVFPEGDWRWQLAPIDAVCRHIVASLSGAPATVEVRHATAAPLAADVIGAALAARGFALTHQPLPAVVTALAATPSGSARAGRAVAALNLLIREYGPRAALSLADAPLETRRPLPAARPDLLDALLPAPEN